MDESYQALNLALDPDHDQLLVLSDNGGSLPLGSKNNPYRGGKHDLQEGGVRTRAWIQSSFWEMPTAPIQLVVEDLSLATLEIVLGTQPTWMLETSPYHVVDQRPRRWAVTEDTGWKLVKEPNQPEKLYDLNNDPKEERPFLSPRKPNIRQRLKNQLL